MTVLDSCRQALSIYLLSGSILKIFEKSTETAFGIPKFKSADADLMAPVLEATCSVAKWEKLFFTYLLVHFFTYVLVNTANTMWLYKCT